MVVVGETVVVGTPGLPGRAEQQEIEVVRDAMIRRWQQRSRRRVFVQNADDNAKKCTPEDAQSAAVQWSVEEGMYNGSTLQCKKKLLWACDLVLDESE